MKRFFTASLKPRQPQQTPATAQQQPLHIPTLTPKYTVPPVPHPYPYERILILATQSGLLLKQEAADPDSCVRLSWEKEVVVEQVEGSEELDWENAVLVLGLVGVLQLFTTSYLLVITSRKECGQLLDPLHQVYSVKTVTPIPLTYDRATKCLTTLSTLKTPRPPLTTSDTISSISSDAALPRVHFASESDIPTSSGATTPALSEIDDDGGQELTINSQSQENIAVARTIASRMSFWQKMTKRRTLTNPAGLFAPQLEQPESDQTSMLTQDSATPSDTSTLPGPSSSATEQLHESALPSESSSLAPDTALSSIIASAATSTGNFNAPTTVAERHSELEEKIVRECVKEFSKGSMYFAYTFDITRSLQHKHDLLTKSVKTNHLLADLNILPRKLRRSPSPPPPLSPRSIPLPQSPRVSTSEKPSSPKEPEIEVLAEPSPTLPLWRRVDRQFWWNEWLIKPFVDAGFHSYVLPIMQGYFQIATFNVPDPLADYTPMPEMPSAVPPSVPGKDENKDQPTAVEDAVVDDVAAKAGIEALVQKQVEDPGGHAPDASASTSTPTSAAVSPRDAPVITETAPDGNLLQANPTPGTQVTYAILSRRSRDRAGFRYQRRGIDDEARVANFVETETIVGIEREGRQNVFSYVQIRGSIPLFWTQTGYGLKPAPALAQDRTREQNIEALRKHFKRTVAAYGPHCIVNLAEQHGKEAAVTTAYREYVGEMNESDVRYHEYDFHTETKGMKYENISKLIDVMERTFDSQGYLWVSGNTLMSEQKGVFRVNCIDCLDRTNVVQSAFARYVLNKQLGAVALLNPSIEGRSDTDVVFNDVWANNGDAISRAYAGTSALKGDFTRTGKRDLSGLLNDGVNSLARMYTSTFSDWFSQAVIDFMLGNRSLSVFSEFLLKLQSSDPRDLIRLSKIRAEAISTSVSRVLEEGERLLSGWTLFAPMELNTKMGDKWEEKVLLLTVRALYIISYDYTLQKVKIYTRVPLGDILGITKGAYILSPLEEASRDPKQNAGFVIHFLLSRHVTRTTSYSVRNSLESPPASPPTTRTSFPSAAALARSLSRRNTTLTNAATAGSNRASGTSTPRQRPLSLVRDMAASQSISAKIAPDATTTFAAFKMLPIDPTRMRPSSSGGSALIMEPADDLTGASSCQEAVEMIVENIRLACKDVGSAHEAFVKDEDVVGLAEAQKMTSMYAKMEYGVKRMLWLGG